MTFTRTRLGQGHFASEDTELDGHSVRGSTTLHQPREPSIFKFGTSLVYAGPRRVYIFGCTEYIYKTVLRYLAFLSTAKLMENGSQNSARPY